MQIETARIGKRGTVVIPARIREKYGFEEGSHLTVKELPEGVLLQPVVTLPLEIYTPERKAEFLLTNAVTREDHERAVAEVRKLGLDPEQIPHVKHQSGTDG